MKNPRFPFCLPRMAPLYTREPPSPRDCVRRTGVPTACGVAASCRRLLRRPSLGAFNQSERRSISPVIVKDSLAQIAPATTAIGVPRSWSLSGRSTTRSPSSTALQPWSSWRGVHPSTGGFRAGSGARASSGSPSGNSSWRAWWTRRRNHAHGQRRRTRACARRAVRPGDWQEPQHRAAGLGADLRPPGRGLQPRQGLEPPGRPGTRRVQLVPLPGCAAWIHRSLEAFSPARHHLHLPTSRFMRLEVSCTSGRGR